MKTKATSGAIGKRTKTTRIWDVGNGATSKGGAIDEHDDDSAQGTFEKSKKIGKSLSGTLPICKNSLPLEVELESSIV